MNLVCLPQRRTTGIHWSTSPIFLYSFLCIILGASVMLHSSLSFTTTSSYVFHPVALLLCLFSTIFFFPSAFFFSRTFPYPPSSYLYFLVLSLLLSFLNRIDLLLSVCMFACLSVCLHLLPFILLLLGTNASVKGIRWTKSGGRETQIVVSLACCSNGGHVASCSEIRSRVDSVVFLNMR